VCNRERSNILPISTFTAKTVDGVDYEARELFGMFRRNCCKQKIGAFYGFNKD